MTTDPPDLRTLAARAICDSFDSQPDDAHRPYPPVPLFVGTTSLPPPEPPCAGCFTAADAVLAAVLPTHRTMVIAEAAGALIAADLGPRDPGWMFADDPVALVRRLATTGPPTDSASTLPGQSGPAVPEATDLPSAGCDDCDNVCTEKCTCPGCTAPQAGRP